MIVLPKSGRPWLAAGFLMMLFSGFGQTYFISLFSAHLTGALGLSAGAFGSIYAAATLSSAVALLFAGRLADAERLRALALCLLVALAAACLLIAGVGSAAVLLVALFGLRFFGQGMVTHVAMTAMGRWFPQGRGTAVAVAALGMPAGEALLPGLTVGAIAVLGWRGAYVAAAAVLVVVAVPLIAWLLAGAPGTAPGDPSRPGDVDDDRRQWTRAEVLRDPLFFAMLPGLLAPSFVWTGFVFNQVPLSAVKGWDISWFAFSFPFSAAAAVVASLTAGAIIDRIGGRRILPVFLLPLALGLAIAVTAHDPRLLPAAFALCGLTIGSAQTLLGALWAELYGTLHLGAVRSLATSGMVLASALAPALIGLLVDAGFGLEAIVLALSVYLVAAAASLALVARRIRIRASAAGGIAADRGAG